LLELVGLLGVLEDKGVQVTLAADLELDQGGLLAALDASRAGVLAAADLDELGRVSMASFQPFRVPEAEREEIGSEKRGSMDEDSASRVGRGFCNCCSAFNVVAKSLGQQENGSLQQFCSRRSRSFSRSNWRCRRRSNMSNPDATSFVLIHVTLFPRPVPLSISLHLPISTSPLSGCK